MKTVIVAALAAVGLGGCVAVPAPGPYAYYPDAYYYPAPAVGVVGVYSGPAYYGRRHYYRHRW
jgi:hypothetical protein